jgi:hypothetical protein
MANQRSPIFSIGRNNTLYSLHQSIIHASASKPEVPIEASIEYSRLEIIVTIINSSLSRNKRKKI